MRRNEQMKRLDQRIAELRAQRDQLDAKIAALEEFKAEISDEPMPSTEPAKRQRAPRSNVKSTVLSLLEQVGGSGLNAAIAVDLAKEQHGLDLDRGSVSSLLSRLKNEGTVSYDGRLYRLPQNAPRDEQPSASVYPLPRASGDVS